MREKEKPHADKDMSHTNKIIGMAESAPTTNSLTVPEDLEESLLAQSDIAPVKSGARIEILARGKYWTWRWGSGANRGGQYGGKFDDPSDENGLSDTRKAEYEINKSKRKKGKNSAGPSQRNKDIGRRDSLSTGGGVERESGERLPAGFGIGA